MPFYMSRFAYTAEASSDASDIAEGQEWFSAKEAGRLLGAHARTIRFYRKNGTITHYQKEPSETTGERILAAQYGRDCAGAGRNQLFSSVCYSRRLGK
jgi:hypothetical protein